MLYQTGWGILEFARGRKGQASIDARDAATPASSRLTQRKEYAAGGNCGDTQAALARNEALLDGFPDHTAARFYVSDCSARQGEVSSSGAAD
jgi:hypothetical protein